ncbi:MAG TPA: hypothetical protein VF294_09110, partial [Polyangiaceae bacterium]
AAPTTFTYGTLQAGTYYLTQETFYPGAAAHTTSSVAATLKITVTNEVATLNVVVSDGTRYTLTITMAAPSSSPPTAEAVACTNNSAFTTAVGDITGSLDYNLTSTKLTIYIPAYRLLEVYTLQ